jgi:hypothetical protein
MSSTQHPKSIEAVLIQPPEEAQRVARNAQFTKPDQKKGRYSLPNELQSTSPIGYRKRISFTHEEAKEVMTLLSMSRPTAFQNPVTVTEQELFEETSLGILSSRQSTNYRGFRQITLGPDDSEKLANLMKQLPNTEAPVLDNASYSHITLSRPYRTPFTMLLTLIGHKPFLSLFTVPIRAFRKRMFHADDIPTIGYLPDLHIGILADAQERACVIASSGQRRAQTFMRPFAENQRTDVHGDLCTLAGLTPADRRAGWRIAIVTQVGQALEEEQINIAPKTLRKLGANLMAYRSERIQPGVNQEEKAPDSYQTRQNMDIPPELVIMAGRAGYNAFSHWTGCPREKAKEMLMLERIDVLTPNGKNRLREVRRELHDITDRVVKNIPLWADLPVGKAFSRNAGRGRKAFALAGQRIYIAGISKSEIEESGIPWSLAVRGVGAAASRCSLVAEIMGSTCIPEGCDLLAGICMMAGPVNQNDIGKSFYGFKDLLSTAFPHRHPTSLLVWTMKAKTVADPIGNEEQLMNAERKGALVDLRAGPHEVAWLRTEGSLHPMRSNGDHRNQERAFSEQDNFVSDPDGVEITGNRGKPWPDALRNQEVWSIR